MSRSVGGGAWKEGHQSSARACEPEISSSRLICRALSVSGQDRKLPRGEGLDTLPLPSNGERFHRESSVRKRRNADTSVTAVPCMRALKTIFSIPKTSPASVNLGVDRALLSTGVQCPGSLFFLLSRTSLLTGH